MPSRTALQISSSVSSPDNQSIAGGYDLDTVARAVKDNWVDYLGQLLVKYSTVAARSVSIYLVDPASAALLVETIAFNADDLAVTGYALRVPVGWKARVSFPAEPGVTINATVSLQQVT